jgi:hypothetical protein
MMDREIGNDHLENREAREAYGKNVEVIIKFMRHGERDKEGVLLDVGRRVTKEKAEDSGIKPTDFHAVKAIGSNAYPQGERNIGRSLETADIYSHAIAGDEAFNTRRNEQLNYMNLKSPLPLDHQEVYNSLLPKNFDDLSDEGKIKASKKAQSAEVDMLFSLDSEAAENYRKECAGAYAYVIDHYQRVAKRLKTDSRVLLPAGGHGGMMEFLLQQALVRRVDGIEKIGLEKVEEIGGEFDPSDSYNIDIKTDDEGKFAALKVSFDNKNRPQEEMYLDPDKFAECLEYYKKLHELE